jgi:hypothetical protein
MGQELLLVGSIPLETVEDVMLKFGGELGRYLPAMPDGEVGERRSWVNRFSYQLFNGHADLETMRKPSRADGREPLLPRTRDESWQFKVAPNVDKVRFGLPGLRLGYARDATSSYFVFKTLREKGLLPADMRFQISIPMVNSVVRPMYFPNTGDVDKIRPGFEEALAAEIDVIIQRIPAKDLAIQWDCAWELLAVYGEAGSKEADVETHVAPIRRLSAKLPNDVALGFHFCFGTFGGWPAFAPKDLGRAADLINAVFKNTPRRIDWIHIPTLDRSDGDFYAPLAGIDQSATRTYLGMIHSMDSLAQRLDVARKFVPEFGLAAYCGFGRIAPDRLPQILGDHLKALEIAHK